jgi:putative phosphoribosyl transferase
MTFASRQDAGYRLGHHLHDRGVKADAVVGLPRGGVVVAAEVARILQCSLGVLVVRKIGHPWHREFAVGALAEHAVMILDDDAIGSDPRVRAELEEVIHEESERLREYQHKFHRGAQPEFGGKSILLVDDGLATGSTTEAAALSVRKMGAQKIIIAAPVASANAVERVGRVADEVMALLVDPDFDAVGCYYKTFPQTSTGEVLELLEAVNSAHSTCK